MIKTDKKLQENENKKFRTLKMQSKSQINDEINMTLHLNNSFFLRYRHYYNTILEFQYFNRKNEK